MAALAAPVHLYVQIAWLYISASKLIVPYSVASSNAYRKAYINVSTYIGLKTKEKHRKVSKQPRTSIHKRHRHALQDRTLVLATTTFTGTLAPIRHAAELRTDSAFLACWRCK